MLHLPTQLRRITTLTRVSSANTSFYLAADGHISGAADVVLRRTAASALGHPVGEYCRAASSLPAKERRLAIHHQRSEPTKCISHFYLRKPACERGRVREAFAWSDARRSTVGEMRRTRLTRGRGCCSAIHIVSLVARSADLPRRHVPPASGCPTRRNGGPSASRHHAGKLEKFTASICPRAKPVSAYPLLFPRQASFCEAFAPLEGRTPGDGPQHHNWVSLWALT